VDTQQRETPGFPITGAAVVIAIILGVLFVQQIPFKGSRPKAPGDGALPSYGPEDVQSRLWEDPFGAVLRHRKGRDFRTASELISDYLHALGASAAGTAPDIGGGGHSGPDGVLSNDTPATQHMQPDHGFNSLARQIIDRGIDKILVLGVMVYGGPYDEYVERRIRRRYATLSAMGVRGYIPDDSRHLGYIELASEGAVQARERLPEFVPYEWFGPEFGSEPKPPVLILWLAQEGFQSTPLRKIGQLRHRLKTAIEKAAGNSSVMPEVPFTILGPADSCGLLAMVNEKPPVGPDAAWETLKGVRIFSASATVEGRELFPKGEEAGNITRVLAENIPSGKFFRTIGSDRRLADALVDELARRGADPIYGHSHIVLISEWDTIYGRSMPRTFIRSVRDHYDSKFQTRTTVEEIDWIHRFSYLRGIDGRLPGSPDSDGQASATADSGDENEKTKALEPPVGRSQYDYFRRLTTRVERLDWELKRDGHGGIKAIGVLGIDVYDKLLVLQALRPQFPGVVFFTTDLDASLLHPEEFKWTHNLVIASNFGLELHPDLQGRVLPFRDTYQTSFFFSTLIALSNREDCLGQEFFDECLKQPRIYEIGRSGAFDISIRKEGGEDKRCLDCLSVSDLTSIHPQQAFPNPYKMVPIGLVAVLFLCLYSRCYREIPWPHLALMAFTVLGAVVSAVIIFNQLDGGEPVALFEGVSLWPTEFLRFLAGVLALWFLYMGCRNLKDGNKKVDDYLEWIDDTRECKVESGINAAEFWESYHRESAPKRRFPRRVIPLAVVHFGLCGLIIYTFGPPIAPYRGLISFIVDKAVLLMAIPSLIVLIFLVLDATKLSVRFIRDLSEEKVVWPKYIVDKFVGKLKMDARYLNEWISIQVIARHTEAVGNLIYYPFVVIILMLISRSSYFDNWHLPVGLFVVIMLALAYCIYCAIILRRSAEQARQKAIERLQIHQIYAKGQKETGENVSEGRKEERTDESEQIALLINSIHTIRRGAFASFSHQPFVRALALFFGSGGSILLLEYLR
jgi:hypothetical protein